MKKHMFKFHIVAMSVNLLICIIAQLLTHQIGSFWDAKFGIRISSSYGIIMELYTFFFFWIFTFSIYLIKDYKKHILLFFLFGVFIVFFYEIYYIYIKYNLSDRGVDFILRSIKIGYYDILPFIILTSIGIHYSQLFIGKKFLPELYKSK